MHLYFIREFSRFLNAVIKVLAFPKSTQIYLHLSFLEKALKSEVVKTVAVSAFLLRV